MDMECAPQTGMLNPFLVQLPEMSSTSSTSSRITALPMASTVPKAIVLLTALRDDAAPAAQQVVESGVTTKSRVVLRLAHQLPHDCTPHGPLFQQAVAVSAQNPLCSPFLPGRSIGDWAVPVWHTPFQSEPSPAKQRHESTYKGSAW